MKYTCTAQVKVTRQLTCRLTNYNLLWLILRTALRAKASLRQILTRVLLVIGVVTIHKVAFMFRIIVLGPISPGHATNILILTVVIDVITMELP